MYAQGAADKSLWNQTMDVSQGNVPALSLFLDKLTARAMVDRGANEPAKEGGGYGRTASSRPAHGASWVSKPSTSSGASGGAK